MSTPRTDAVEFPVMCSFGNEHPMVVRSTLSRELETELAEAKARIAELEESLHYANGTADLAIKHRDAAEARIAELEAKGSPLNECAQSETIAFAPTLSAMEQASREWEMKRARSRLYPSIRQTPAAPSLPES